MSGKVSVRFICTLGKHDEWCLDDLEHLVIKSGKLLSLENLSYNKHTRMCLFSIS